jgi:uncharacterized protein (DUF2267 family)
MSEDFPNRIRAFAGLGDDDDVERPAAAVLSTLGDHLSGALARRLAEPLPEPFALPLRQAGETSEPGGLDFFYARVSERSGGGDAARLTAAVLRALVEVSDPETVRAARDQLPDELTPLLQTQTEEGDTSAQLAAGPIEPDAPNLSGPDRPL